MNQHIPKGLSIVLVSSIASLGLGLGPAFADNLEKPASLQEQSSLLAQVSTDKQNPAAKQSSIELSATAEQRPDAEPKTTELSPTVDETVTSNHNLNPEKTLAENAEKSYNTEQTKRSKRSLTETETAHEEVSFAGEWFYTQLSPDEQSAYRQLRKQATTSFNDAHRLEDIEVSLPENSNVRF